MIIRRFIPLFFILLIVGVAIWYVQQQLQKPTPLYIGLAMPLTQSSEINMQQAVSLYLAQLNKKGGIDGHEVRLITTGDNSNGGQASKIAKQLIESQALVVIGHETSDASMIAGGYYQQAHLAAISPTATNVKVTQNNDWYFRTIFNDQLQGKFLAYYAHKILDANTIAVINDGSDYGLYLANIFIDTLKNQNGVLSWDWQVKMKDKDVEDKIKIIVNILKNDKETQAVFLSTRSKFGVELVKAIRDANLKIIILTPNDYDSKDFINGFRKFIPSDNEKEIQDIVNYYTNGIYVSTPLIFATADKSVQTFRETYYQKFGTVPDWQATFAYDAVHVAVEAIKRANITQKPEQSLAQQREQVRQALANINSQNTSIQGITGINYFDAYGDMNKMVNIAIFRQQQLMPALRQLQTIRNIQEVADAEYFEKQKNLVKFNSQYFYDVNIVYTGVDLVDITNLNLENLTCEIEFKIWFRFNGDINPEDIIFNNAFTPITLENPIESMDYKQLHYRLYNVKGQFKLDFLTEPPMFNHHFVGLSFMHKYIAHHNMVYIVDNIGMGLDRNSKHKLLQQYRDNHILSVSLPWNIIQVRLFQDLITRSILGHPNYLNNSESGLSFSRFNVVLDLQKKEFILSNYFSLLVITPILLIIAISIFVLILIEKHPKILLYRKPIFIAKFLLSILLLVSIEIIMNKQAHNLRVIFHPLMTFVNILWWVIPTVFFNIFIEIFIWQSLEQRANRSVPKVLKGITSSLIYLFSFFAVIGFVFNMQITGLLATSGVIAMIIGLAIQLNISNIFSGIALNLENPFRIGDWIKVKDFPEGQLLDMTWRSTRIRTRDNALLCIPNSLAAETAVINFSKHASYRLNLYLHIDIEHHPERVRKVLLDACYVTDKIISEPAPAVLFPEIKDGIAIYLVACSIVDYGQRPSINHQLWLKLWTHLNQAHIYPAVKTQQIYYQRAKVVNTDLNTERLQLIDIIDIFSSCSSDLKYAIAQKLRSHQVAINTKIVQQGDAGDSLFIIAEGVVSVSILNKQQHVIEVARLGTGAFFGEMALLTGEERTATVTTLTRTMLFELTKADLMPFIANHPELSSSISQILMQRQQATENQMDMPFTDYHVGFDDGFSDRMRQKILNFFGVK